ncbi:MAG: hypothetical protein AAGH78_00450 [Cyanobacteria bacterium P01_H01_bin.58]
MKFEFVPLLHLQRDFYTLPRGPERFRTYLETLLNADASDVEFMPLVVMNPMGKEHIAQTLDTLLAMDADAIAAQAIATISEQFEDNVSPFKLGLVVVDDLKGGWTNRYTTEFSARFELKASLRRRWLTVILWASETPTQQTVCEATLTTVYRLAYIQKYGFACTLQDMMRQEGYAMARAGCQQPKLEAEDLTYTREVIKPYLETQNYPIILSCLFGDVAAQTLGYVPQGLSNSAGLALALHDAQHPKT